MNEFVASDQRLDALIAQSHGMLDEAIRMTRADGRKVAGIVILFSGGNDSTTVAHLFRGRATHAAHANTGIGIEQTRQFVRDTCASWDLPLLEKRTKPGEGYEDLVLGRVLAKTGANKGKPVWRGGFPGPGAHWLMYQRLKERSLIEVRRDLVSNPRDERVIFIAGRRASESKRRNKLAEKSPIERRGSIVWVSPIINWAKSDLNAYRKRFGDVPRNEVSDLLHMSGECLCGAFAHRGELEEIGDWYPEVVHEIHQLERKASKAGIDPVRCKWGWGAGRERPSKTGPLCSTCDARYAAQIDGQIEVFEVAALDSVRLRSQPDRLAGNERGVA